MKRYFLALVFLAMAAGLSFAAKPTPTPTPKPSPTPTATPNPSPTPTPVATPTPTPIVSGTASPCPLPVTYSTSSSTVSSEKGQTYYLVCHNGMVICLPQAAIPAHVGHGDIASSVVCTTPGNTGQKCPPGRPNK